MTALSVAANVEAELCEFTANVERLLTEFSSLYLARTSSPGLVFFNVNGNHAFEGLPLPGRQLQSKLLRERGHLYPLLDLLTRSLPVTDRKRVDEAKETFDRLIQQDGCTWSKNITETATAARLARDNILEVLNSLYDPTPNDLLYVPDTNALYANPQLETWRFDSSRPFTILLIPTVLADLDRHKVEHKNESLREKASGLIRRIKGYKDRGKLIDGVPLSSGVSVIQSLATEPTFAETLPWLDRNNDDDRIIAACFEIMHARPRSAVLLVTADINLQNKAEFARLPFVEPPPAK
ncbi:MAG TPA: PIN domain-containing protein [Gemmatimonadaceae bacterium]|nr:PIN domain-containing protein [Gemmatimonadaceae bacterium]